MKYSEECPGPLVTISNLIYKPIVFFSCDWCLSLAVYDCVIVGEET